MPPRAIGRGTGSLWNAALSYNQRGIPFFVTIQKPPRIIIDDWIIPVIITLTMVSPTQIARVFTVI